MKGRRKGEGKMEEREGNGRRMGKEGKTRGKFEKEGGREMGRKENRKGKETFLFPNVLGQVISSLPSPPLFLAFFAFFSLSLCF